LEVLNYRIRANKYLQAAAATANAQLDFLDKQHELGQTPLSDPSKIPREVVSELYEASQVSKVASSKQPDFEFKDKTGVSAGELLAYLRAVVDECCMLTFGEEKGRLSKLISKLHRVLLATLPTYSQRCQLVLPEIVPETDAAGASKKEIAPRGQVLCHWADFAGRPSSLLYILGPFDTESTKDRLPTPVDAEEPTAEVRRQRAEKAYEDSLIHVGKVDVDPIALSQLYQDTRDLISKMRASEAQSADKNTRDRKGYKETFDTLIRRLGNLFKPPNLPEEQADQDIDCLTLVEDLLPELSIRAVEQLSVVLQKGLGSHFQDPLLSGILRRFHRVRYVA
jgi:hypothetical protein